MLPPLTFVLGGASSGKSFIAEKVVRGQGLARIYVATAQPFDDEMRAKILAHQADRAADGWTTFEEPRELAALIGDLPSSSAVLLDCATMWLSNTLLADADLDQEIDGLIAALGAAPGPTTVVSNEVGLGIVPDTALGRQFRVAQGALNCRLAALADCVINVTAGLPVVLKGTRPEALS